MFDGKQPRMDFRPTQTTGRYYDEAGHAIFGRN